jgi:hypothetical protein
VGERTSLLIFIGRWLAVLPASAVAAAIAYFVSAIANGIGGFLVSGLVWLFAAGFAGYAAVLTAQVVAPSAKRAAGVSITTVVLLFVAFTCISIADGEFHGKDYPTWYVIILECVMLVGAVSALTADLSDGVKLESQWPAIVRWIAFIPSAIVGWAIVAIGLSLAVAIPLHGVVPPFIDVVLRFVSGLVFIAIATAVVLAGRRVVVSVIGAVWAIPGVLLFLGSLLRPWLIPWLEHVTHRELYTPVPAGLQALQAFSFIAAAAIPLFFTFAGSGATVRHDVAG